MRGGCLREVVAHGGSTAVEPPVSDHPKCRGLVVIYGRWSRTRTRVGPQGQNFEVNQEWSGILILKVK